MMLSIRRARAELARVGGVGIERVVVARIAHVVVREDRQHRHAQPRPRVEDRGEAAGARQQPGQLFASSHRPATLSSLRA